MTWDEEVAAHRRALDTSFAVFRRTPHEALLWLTTVISAWVVTIRDDISDPVRAAIAQYDVVRANAYRRSGRTYRNAKGWTRFCGSIEFDLIHPKIAQMCSRMKAGLLAELGIDVTALRDDQRIVVLHEHAIIDHRGHASVAAFKRDLRKVWPGDRRVHGAQLYAEGTVAENLRNLAEYTGKFRFKYSIAWDGRKTRYIYSGEYEPEWVNYVRGLYISVGFSKLLSANITVQCGTSRMHNTRPLYRGELAVGDVLQLKSPDTLETTANDDTKYSYCEYSNERSSEDDGGTMKAIEIDPYLSHERISADAMRDIENALARQGPGLAPEQLALMYGDEERDLRIVQQRLSAAKTRAEIDKLRAAAALDRADAHLTRAAPVCCSANRSDNPTPASEAPSVRSPSPAWPCAGPGVPRLPRPGVPALTM